MSNIARLVSSVSASGSTWTNRAAAGGERRDVVGGEQLVRRLVGADRQQLLIRELGHDQKVPCNEEDLMTESGYRVEHDSMGEVRVPAEARGARRPSARSRTSRSPGGRSRAALVHALALIKAEAARVNQLDRPTKDAIAAAAEEVASGAHDDQFPIDVFQTGSGTSSNMNANEVIARLAVGAARARRSTRTTTSTCRSRRTTCSRRPCTSRRRSRSTSGSCPRSRSSRRRCAEAA